MNSGSYDQQQTISTAKDEFAEEEQVIQLISNIIDLSIYESEMEEEEEKRRMELEIEMLGGDKQSQDGDEKKWNYFSEHSLIWNGTRKQIQNVKLSELPIAPQEPVTWISQLLKQNIDSGMGNGEGEKEKATLQEINQIKRTQDEQKISTKDKIYKKKISVNVAKTEKDRRSIFAKLVGKKIKTEESNNTNKKGFATVGQSQSVFTVCFGRSKRES